MKKHASVLGVGIHLNGTDLLRAKLLSEISEYEHQQSELKTNGSYVNFTMIQTYKELIAARKKMLSMLPVSYWE